MASARKRKARSSLFNEDGMCMKHKSFSLSIEMSQNFSCLLFCWFVVVLLTLSYFSSVADEESTIEEQENMEGEADYKAELVDLTKDGIFLIPQFQFQCKTWLACVHSSLLLVTVCLAAF